MEKRRNYLYVLLFNVQNFMSIWLYQFMSSPIYFKRNSILQKILEWLNSVAGSGGVKFIGLDMST